MLLRFFKMTGAGNDFIVVDNRARLHDLDPATIAALCDRHRGVGADGLLMVEPATTGADFRFRYYNADGGEAEMCGNGARCFGRFAAHLGKEILDQVRFETKVGHITAEMIGDAVRITMPEPSDLQLDLELAGAALPSLAHFLNTGVPHAVSFLPSLAELKELDVESLGRQVRQSSTFGPAGTNANFAAILAPNRLALRTYERGVEGETLACGTGIVAAALLHHVLTAAASPIDVEIKGGDTLRVEFDASGSGAQTQFSEVTLTGPADFVFEGTIAL